MQPRSQNGSMDLWRWWHNMCIPHDIDCHHVGQDNPDGQLSKDKMMEMYSSVLTGTKSRTFVDQIFQKFDSDNSGSIDFKVFISVVKKPLKILNLECVRSSCWPLTCLRLATLRRNWDGLSKCLIAIFLFKIIFDHWSLSMSLRRYDKDGSGSIEIEEMVEIVGNLFELEGLSKVSR